MHASCSARKLTLLKDGQVEMQVRAVEIKQQIIQFSAFQNSVVSNYNQSTNAYALETELNHLKRMLRIVTKTQEIISNETSRLTRDFPLSQGPY